MRLLLGIMILLGATLLPSEFGPLGLTDVRAEPAVVQKNKRDRGELLFNRCRACHTLTAGERPRLGPHLEGLFDRTAGSLDGFKFSEALQRADFRWTPDRLDTWLKAPNAFLPGNRMSFAGMPAEQDRVALIRYLQTATKKP